jgi:hypothetical protein
MSKDEPFREEAKNPSGGNVLRLIRIRLATQSLEEIPTAVYRTLVL